jgi:hypothetical protein
MMVDAAAFFNRKKAAPQRCDERSQRMTTSGRSGSPSGPPTQGSLSHTLRIKTERRTQLLDITREVAAVVAGSGCLAGLCHLYVPHTTAGITINENDDPPSRATSKPLSTASCRATPATGITRATPIRTLSPH